MAFIRALTDCGDLAVLLPLIGVLTLWIVLTRRSRLVLWWLIALAICIGVTGVLKIYFFACPPLSDLHSPSGHTSLSILVYGGLTVAVASAASGWRRIAVIAVGASFVTGIAVSRILVEAHSIPEVLLGSLIGAAALYVFARDYSREPMATAFLPPLVAVCTMLVMLLNGHEVRAEEFLHQIALYLAVNNWGCR
jgi:membrane-associated phospholipid phosphatase